MSCKHAEDVCQDCLEKVTTDDERMEKVSTDDERRERIKQKLVRIIMDKILDRKEEEDITTEEEEEEEEEEVSSWSPRKTSTEKANEIFMAASSLALAGYVAFWNVKFLLKTGDIAVFLAKSIFQNLAD